jgi:hypothetical protein
MRHISFALATLVLFSSGLAAAQSTGAPITAAAITKQLSPVDEGTPATIELVTIVPKGKKLTATGVVTPGTIVYLPATMQQTDCQASGTTGTDCRQRFQFQVNANIQCTLNGQYRMNFSVNDGTTSFVTFSLQSENFCSYVTVNACVPTPGPIRVDAGQALHSCNGGYVLTMQKDGNFVLYNKASQAIWASGTNGRGGTFATFLADGNFVVYASANLPIWSSNSGGHPGAKLAVQDDGNVVVYANSTAVWATNTQGR